MSDPRLLNQFFHQAMAVRDAPAEGLPEELRAGVWPYEEDESPYFTMKLVEGRDLAAVLELLRKNDPQAQRDFPLEVRINIFCRICEAMAYAHQHGIIHLDLKPANIEVSAHGEVLVCDWGLARVLDEVCEDPVLK